jgi:hypothetical protein
VRQLLKKRHVVRALIWGLAGGMVLLSIWRWISLADSAVAFIEPRSSATAMRSVGRVALPEQASFEEYRFALERPLFHPSRRPFPDRKSLAAIEAAMKARQTVPAIAAPPPPPPPPLPPQGIQLRGTVFAGPVQSAVFERGGSPNYLRIRVGEQLDGWTLVKIGREEVVLRLGDQSVTWPLAKPNDGKRSEIRQRRS